MSNMIYPDFNYGYYFTALALTLSKVDSSLNCCSSPNTPAVEE